MRTLRKIILSPAIVLLLGCALMFIAANPIGTLIGGRLGPKLIRVSKGKIAAPATFVAGRITEASALLCLAMVLLFFFKALRRRFENQRTIAPYSWTALSIAAFTLINLWCFAAMRTCFFWGLFYTGKETSNLTQFEFKKILLKENTAPRQLILLGSSQTRSQIDENLLNERLGRQIWTTELTFPGSRGIDMVLISRRLKGFPGDDLVCYVSENYFYNSLFSESAPYFLNIRDLPLLRRLGLASELRTSQFVYGMIGQFVPLFRLREPITDRLLGRSLGRIPQVSYDANLETNLLKRAELGVPTFKLGPDAQLLKGAFEAFITEAEHQNRRVILLEGKMNPLLTDRLDSSVRADLKAFLRNLQKTHSNVTLITEDQLPPQSPADYEDLSHVNELTQARFSAWFADYVHSRFKLAAAEASSNTLVRK